MDNHLVRIVQNEMPNFLKHLYFLRITRNLDDNLIEQTLKFFNELLHANYVRSEQRPQEQWQQSYWKILHATGFLLSELGQNDMTFKFAAIMLRFNELLPCEICAQHYAAMRKYFAWQLFAGVDPGMVMLKLHNQVSTNIGKPTFSVKQVCDLYGVEVGVRNKTPSFSFEEFQKLLAKKESQVQLAKNGF